MCNIMVGRVVISVHDDLHVGLQLCDGDTLGFCLLRASSDVGVLVSCNGISIDKSGDLGASHTL